MDVITGFDAGPPPPVWRPGSIIARQAAAQPRCTARERRIDACAAAGGRPRPTGPVRSLAVSGAHRSLWLREALAAEPQGAGCRPLSGAHQADVAIIGGGYTGMWTAYQLKRRQPGLDVVILEADICGGGASGRNGGFVLSWWPKLETLVERYGETHGLELAQWSDDAVGALGGFCAEHGVDAHYVHGGWLWVATSQAQMGAWEGSVRACEERNLDAFQRLSPEEVAARAGSPTHLAGVFEPNAATVQPALLARGLRRVLLDMGVRIHEGSPVTSLRRSSPAVVRTAAGQVRAGAVVVASNVWAAKIRELRRLIVPLGSDIAATAPIPERLAEIGWTGGEAVSDSHLMVNYYRTTRDGRIAWGKGGGRLTAAGRVPALHLDRRHTAQAARRLRTLYPMLADVPIDAEWSGWVDRSVTGLPVFGRLSGQGRVVYGIGFSGNGVGPCHVAGHVLASLALGADDQWSACGLVSDRHDRFPVEPVRFAGSLAVRAAVDRKERAEDAGRRPDPVSRWLAGFAPSGYFKVTNEEDRAAAPADTA
jgi:putative aminophosphonate oxidoreductase